MDPSSLSLGQQPKKGMRLSLRREPRKIEKTRETISSPKRSGTPQAQRLNRSLRIIIRKNSPQPPYSIPRDGPTQLISRTTDASAEEGNAFCLREESLGKEKKTQKLNTSGDKASPKRPGTPRAYFRVKEKSGKHLRISHMEFFAF
ncbi:hypothetical protein CEXT_127951 [Caerostris extrusa]|uniref:Uncharacterized protein n=1 Tax=Caerostris extrusa TaxID=172846 RepID=A0AAV4SQX7_CAEEX|nr:hypothetical protein CEXT_127951 [Caerostris extrusa]